MVLNIINQDIPVSSLQMTTVGGSCNIIIGWTLQFLAALLPADASNKEIIWSVTNQSGSASITQAGLLTAQTAGTVKVKAATLDGSGIAVSKTVTITSPEVPVSSIQIIPENGISQIYTGNTLKLSADVLPQDASNPAVTWDVRSQGGLGSVSPDGVFTGIQEGFVKVIACSTDGTGISDTMEVEIVTPVSIGENDMGKMLLYPNPGSGFFFLNAGDISIGLIEVVDPGGKILKQMTPGKSAGALHLDLNGYPAGYYFIRVYTPEGVYHQKLIIY